MKTENNIKSELSFNLNPIERLESEIKFFEDNSIKQLGSLLLEELKKDENLKNDYKNKTLKDTWEYIVEQAKEKATSSAYCMSDKEAIGLAIHYIHDGKSKHENKPNYTLTKEVKKSLEEQAKEEYLKEQKAKLAEAERKAVEKEQKAKEKALQKEEDKREKFGEISLFDETIW